MYFYVGGTFVGRGNESTSRVVGPTRACSLAAASPTRYAYALTYSLMAPSNPSLSTLNPNDNA